MLIQQAQRMVVACAARAPAANQYLLVARKISPAASAQSSRLGTAISAD